MRRHGYNEPCGLYWLLTVAGLLCLTVILGFAIWLVIR